MRLDWSSEEKKKHFLITRVMCFYYMYNVLLYTVGIPT